VRFDRFLHLDLLGVAFLLVEFGPEATQGLRILAAGVGFSGLSFTHAFFVIEPG
jgi:hypothetical protein